MSDLPRRSGTITQQRRKEVQVVQVIELDSDTIVAGKLDLHDLFVFAAQGEDLESRVQLKNKPDENNPTIIYLYLGNDRALNLHTGRSRNLPKAIRVKKVYLQEGLDLIIP